MADTFLTMRLSAVLPEGRLAQLTRDIGRDLSRVGIRTRPVERQAVSGERGEAVNLGELALALITSGAVAAMIECFKAYFSRERTLIIKLTRPDGTRIEVDARNVDTPDMREALETISNKTG